ncbi:MAG: hypothetical protein FJY75_03430 [Candidatus Eisenbacteria bacterium]|uniref:Uncharacterized protein n=1 Tax=Eiseniibacteriota bacterium TaxID=2212470 RepID=A0A937X6R1_UNCEI|nr:hypothetical protein [Candidatus Eisenbacteria bacterium]
MKLRRAGRGAPALGLVLAVVLLGAPEARGGWTTHLYMNDIRDLAVTPSGVWCATGGGALFYDFDISGFRAWNRTTDGLASDTLTSVEALADGRIAFGTSASGVSLYEPGLGLWFNQTSLTWPIAGDRVRFIREERGWRLIGSLGGFVAWRDGDVREACQQGIDICGLPGWDITAGIEFDGALWFGAWTGEGSLGGVGRLSYGTTGDWETLNAGLPSRQIVDFAAWGESLYCATTQGIAVWTGARWAERSQGLPAGGAVTDLSAGATRLLAAKSGPIAGVFSWDGAAGRWRRVGPDTLNLQAYCVAEGADGVVWAGTSPLKSGRGWLEPGEDGLWEFVGGEWIQHRRNGPHPVAVYRALTVDDRGRVWAASSASQRGWRISRLENGVWTSFDQRNSPLSNAWVFDLRVRGDELWVGHCCCSRDDDFCVFDIWTPGAASAAVLDSIYNVYDSTEDAWGNLWFASFYDGAAATSKGLFHYDRALGAWTRYSSQSTGGLLVSDRVTAVEAEGERLWIGYQNDGLTRVRLDAQGRPQMSAWSWLHYSAEDAESPLPGNGVRALAAGPGQVWVGTTQGAARWEEGETWRTFRPSPWGLPGSEITDIEITADGAAWVAMRGSGVTRVTRDAAGGFQFEQFRPPDLVNPDATVLAARPGGRDIWIGTSQGLAHYTPAQGAGGASVAEITVFPNPFNPACGVGARAVALPGRAARGTICDASGRVVGRFRDAWSGDELWDGRDLDGRPVAPGLYVIRAQTREGWLTGRVAVLDLPCD